ncbi:T9SS type A sorting domain-containing protein [Flavobacterium qiangtangense]|uniref:T9SS type A sorting domain-containing protein n=1 Tax=Flavobacterium qiangtangense TaxID=1442595 RepID=A0ABW1PPG1_9FLAO
MNQKLLYFVFFVLATTTSKAQFTTPNTGVAWNLTDLVTNAPSAISFSGGIYTLSQNLTIAPNDNLLITSDATININADVQIIVQGAFTADSNAILITATNPATPYNSIIFESGSSGFMRNTTINYGKGIRLSTGDFEMQSCTMSYHIPGTTTSSAINFSTGSPIINNSTFTFNNYPAFSSGANQETSPTLSNNYLFANNQSNTNRPQINMGPSGADTLRIVGNTIIGDPTKIMVGGIAASSLLGNPNKVIIDGNTIRDNRYGITVVGANSSGFIRNNIIEDNDTQNSPNLGGSGISLNASGATTMNIITTNNQIRRNLWGITVLGTARINLGDGGSNLGGNVFADNGNGGQTYALFNNTALPIMAMNNCWIEGTTLTPTNVENVISHQVDDANLGLVTFNPFGCDALSTPNFAIAKPKIYPNPSNGILNISMPENGTASVFAINGMFVQKINLTEGNNTLNLNLASGIYILKTETSEGNFNQKLVIR